MDAGRTLVRPRAYAHVDALRCFAVMVVVVAHSGVGFVPGGSGVTIFFAISGFIITHLVLGEYRRDGGFDLRGFYLRRAMKIFPPFVVVIGLPSLVYGVTVGLSARDVGSQFFFYFNWLLAARNGDFLPGSVVVWSLSIEEQFYLVFALVWLVVLHLRHPVRALVSVALAAVVVSFVTRLVLHLAEAPARRLYFGTDARMEAIAIGVLLAALVFHLRSVGKELPGWVGRDVVVVGAGIAYVVSLVVREDMFRDTLRFTVQAGATAAVIAWGLVSHGAQRLGPRLDRMMRWPAIQLLGLASYSIYLAHYVAIRGLESAGVPIGGVWTPVHVVVSTSVGVLAWRLVEVPVAQWRERRASRAVIVPA